MICMRKGSDGGCGGVCVHAQPCGCACMCVFAWVVDCEQVTVF